MGCCYRNTTSTGFKAAGSTAQTYRKYPAVVVSGKLREVDLCQLVGFGLLEVLNGLQF